MSATATFTPFPATPAHTYAHEEDPLLFKRARTWWLLLALFLIADGNSLFAAQGLHPGLKGEADVSSDSLLFLTAVMWAICAALMVTQIRPTLRMMLHQKAVLSFAVLAFLSTLWSQAPQVSFRKAAILFLYMLVAWFFATYYSPPDQMRLLLALGVIMAMASIAWVIFLPNYGVQPTGEWKGVFGQKNMLANTMFFLFSGLPFCRISSARSLLIVATQAGLPLGLILLSRSRSPLVMVAVVIAVRVLGPLLVRTRKEALPFMLYCLGIGTAMIPIGLAVVLPLLGRDFTFSGRTHTWANIFPLALDHFWLGRGYQAFWIGASGNPAAIILGGIPIISVDNGYLDVMLQCGFVGVLLLSVLLIACARDFGSLLSRSSVPLIAYWYAALIIAIFVGGVTENMFWFPIRIIPFMLVMACAGLRNLNLANTPACEGSS
jgi:exopolysaccharide production protein ExoQ